MRILLTHPTSWPAVRRGMERLFADLERYLRDEGHEVHTVTARRSSGSRPVHGRLARRIPDPAVTYQLRVALAIRRHRPDIVHGLHYLDGAGHRLAGRAGEVAPLVLHIPGIPSAAALAWRPYHGTIFRASSRRATAVIAMSRAAQSALARDFGRRAVVVPNGVFTSEMAALACRVERSERPTVLFPGDATDSRKRVHLLADALALLRESFPGLRMLVAWPIDENTRLTLQARSGVPVEVRDVPEPAMMAALYAEAWVTCLPSVDEAFGLVLVESLACGTPAVGARHGGVPEVLGEPAWLAEPDDARDLARTLERALADSSTPQSPTHCSELAAPFDWSAVGPRLVTLYEEVLESRPRLAWARS